MKKIGLTGGIGSGKSYVAFVLEKMGFPVYYSDLRAKELTNYHPEIQEGLISFFGDSIYEAGELNRKLLAEHIFSNDENRLKVNALIHPIVRNDFSDWGNKQTSKLIFNEAAILFETGANRQFDAMVLVTAPELDRIERVLLRENCTEEEVVSRIRKQWPDSEKRKLTPFVIENDGKKPLLQQIEEVVEQLIQGEI